MVYEIADLSLLSGHYSLEIWLIDTTSAHVYDSIDFQKNNFQKSEGDY